MDDPHSRAYGLAHSAVVVELLKALIAQGHLTPADVKALLTKAGQTLASAQTEVSGAASEHVKLIGEAVGVAR